MAKYILDYSKRYINEFDCIFPASFEHKREIIILYFIEAYIRENVTDMDIFLYVSKNTDFFKSYTKKVLEKYIERGYIKEA